MPTVVLLVVAVLAVGAGLSRPKAIAVAGLIAGVSARTLEHVTGLSQLSFLDDAGIAVVVVCCTVRFWREPSAMGRRALTLFAVFVACGLLGASADGVGLSLSLAAAYAASKGFIFAWAVSKIPWTPSDFDRLGRSAIGIAMVLIACAAFNIARPEAWNSVFLAAELGSVERYDRLSIIGPFVHPYDLAMVCAVLALVLISTRRSFSSRLALYALFVLLIVIVFLTYRRLALIGLVLALPIAFASRPKLASRLLGGTCAAAVAAFIFWPVVAPALDLLSTQYLSSTGRAARTVLAEDAVRTANDNFPLGAGFGRFGSKQAAETYSPLYIEYGYTKIFGLQPSSDADGNSSFLTDSQIAPTLGESGWLGLLAFLGAVFSAIPRGGRVGPQAAAARSLGWAVVVFSLVVAIGFGVFNFPPGSTLLWFFIGLCAAVGRSASTPDSEGRRNAVSAQAATVR